MAKKLQLGYREIEQRLADSFSSRVNPAEVGYQLLYSFGKSERDIERFKEGKGVLKTFDGLLIKGLFCYQPVSMFDLTDQLELLKKNLQIIKAAPKIVAVSDGKTYWPTTCARRTPTKTCWSDFPPTLLSSIR